MELDEFVRETLIQIVRGVTNAQQEVRGLGGFVNPATSSTKSENSSYFAQFDSKYPVFLVNFDVAVEASSSKSGKGEAGLKVSGVVNFGGGGEAATTNATSNRIAFKVPLGLPLDPDSVKTFDESERNFHQKLQGR